MSAPLHVAGGAGSVQVDYRDLLTASRAFDDLASAGRDAAHAVGGGLRTQAARALGPARCGPVGSAMGAVAAALGTSAAESGRLAGLLLSSIHIYRSTDGVLLDPLDRAAVAMGRVGFGTLALSLGRRDAASRQFGRAVPQLTDGLAWLVGEPLELLYAVWVPDGAARVRDLGLDTRPAATAPPRGVADLVGQLALRNTGHHGEVSVSFVIGRDGRTRAIVDIPGTKSWNPWPTHDVTSVGTDARAIDGRPTSYEQGVLTALDRAGVPPTMPVMLVGHSLGGIIAVDAARTALADGRFNVTHVVTAGAPIGRVVGALPRTVSVLALENTADVVPETDGIGNPASVNVTTVSVDDQHGSVGANHDLGTVYQPEAAAVDASDAPSVQAFLSGADGFLQGTSETTHSYWITRS